MFGWTFKKDKRLVKNFTGANLSQEQFDLYKDELLLNKTFNKKARKRYYGFGTPAQLSRADIFNSILNTLAAKGVVFNLEEQPELLERFDKTIRSYLGCNSWPWMPKAYHESEILQQKMKDIRAEYGLVLKEFRMD